MMAAVLGMLPGVHGVHLGDLALPSSTPVVLAPLRESWPAGTRFVELEEGRARAWGVVEGARFYGGGEILRVVKVRAVRVAWVAGAWRRVVDVVLVPERLLRD